MSNSPLVLQSQTSNFSSLIQNGVVVIPLPENVFDEFDLNAFLCGQKEYKVSNPDTLFVMGAFGALANPSSQHHPTLRKLRSAVYKHMQPFNKTLQILRAKKLYATLQALQNFTTTNTQLYKTLQNFTHFTKQN